MTQYKGSQVPQNNESGDDAALAEANHRFANNSSLLAALLRSLARGIGHEGASMNRAEVQLLLQEASERIAAVGKLHALLSKRPRAPMVDLSDHLGQICESLVSSLAFAGRVDLSLGFTTTCLVPTDQVVPLTLIVSEIITNAIKYAHPTGIPGKINLSAVREPGGTLVIELSDDGVGLPEGFDPAKDGGFGLRMVRALGEQIGASVSFHSTGLGLHFQLRLPDKPNPTSDDGARGPASPRSANGNGAVDTAPVKSARLEVCAPPPNRLH